MRKSTQQTPAKGKNLTSSQKKIEPPTPKKFDPQDYKSCGLSIQEITEFKNAFDTFDAHGKGAIDIAEIKEAFINLGFQNQSKLVIRLFDYLDKKNHGTIDFSEFLKICTCKLDENSSKEECDQIFTCADATHSKKFTIYDLKDLIKDLGEHIDDETIEKMFRKADFDDDGYVTQEDFYNIVSQKVYDNPKDEKVSQKAYSTAGKRTSRY